MLQSCALGLSVVNIDNGIGGGTANDGIQNGSEAGISTQLVQALDVNDVLIEQTSSAADGSYELYVPKSVVGTIFFFTSLLCFL